MPDNQDNIPDINPDAPVKRVKHAGGAPRGLKNGKHTKPESKPRGENHGGSKFSDDDAVNIFQWFRDGLPVREIATRLKVSQGTIYHVLQGRTHAHLQPPDWDY